MRKRIAIAVGLTIAALSAPVDAHADVPFAIDVGPGGAAAINDNGQVVGQWTAHFNGFVWTQAGGVVDIGHGGASDINDSGTVVGGLDQAFSWTAAGGRTLLGTLPGDLSSTATAVNASGQIAGTSSGDKGAHAFLWTKDGGMRALGALPGGTASAASGVNDSGQVVGTSNGHAFLWTAADGMTDLGTLPGDTMSIAQAINNQGQVVGESSATNGPDHAFLWTRAGGMVALGTLPGDSSSRAADINDQGQVVGTSTRSDGQPHAFMWTQAGGMAGLSPLPGHQVSSANGINDRGQVVGSSGDRVGEYVVLWGADTTAPTATFKVTRGQRLSTTAVRFRLTLSEPGTAAVKLSWAGHAIARKTVTFAAAGSRSVTLKLTAAQRRKLRRHTKATLSLLAVATDPDHNASTARTRFVLR